MFDLNVTFENRETTHRVIVGKEYYSEVDLEPEEVLAMTFAFLLRYKVPRQTEGACPTQATPLPVPASQWDNSPHQGCTIHIFLEMIAASKQ